MVSEWEYIYILNIVHHLLNGNRERALDVWLTIGLEWGKGGSLFGIWVFLDYYLLLL